MKEKDLGDGRINSMIGTALGYGIVSPKMVPYFAAILLLCFPLIFQNPTKGLLIFACIYGFFWMLTGNDPSQFFERWKQPKKYIAEEPTLDLTPAGIPVPAKPKRLAITYRIKGKNRRYHYIERKFHFVTYGQIELDGKRVGYYLLRRGPQLMFVFGWEVGGHDPSMTSQQSVSILSACNDAINNLPSDIDFKTYQDVTCSCEDYLRQQHSLLSFKEHDVLSQEMIKSRASRARDLSSDGRLLHNKITIFAKYRVILGGDYATKQTWFDEFLSHTQPIVGALQGKDFDSVEAWEKVIDNAYRYAYRKVNSILSSNVGFGMRVRTLTVQNLYERDYLELHHPPVPEIPQYIVYNSFGLQKPIVNNLGVHALGTLFEDRLGIQAVPDFERHFVYLPVKEKYAAFVRLGQVRCFSEDKGSVSLGYIRYWWNILTGTNEPISDCRVVSEFTADRSGFEMFQLDRIISNSVKREALAAKKQTVDVVAMRRREQAVEARYLLEENNIPYWCSAGVWLYRDSVDQLERDVSEVIQRMGATAKVSRVEYTTEDVWFQTWPFEWESFLTKPDHRRQKYLGFQALPLMPTIKVKQVDRKGVMLVTRELNTPLYVDFANRKNHTAIIGTTGAAKSNLMLDAIAEYLFYDHFAVVFDFPRPDGSSTYTVLAPLLEKLGVQVVYHNVRESVMNIIEFPDLRHVTDAKKYQEQWDYVFYNHVELLGAIVIGTTSNSEREGLVKPLITECYSDFQADTTIKSRYERAIEGGFGSAAYQQMPILEDFVNFAEHWFEQFIKRKKETISTLINDTIDVIVTKLRGILRSSLGKSINGVSSFDTKVKVLVVGLTNVSENSDTLIYAMAGLNVLFRGTMSSKKRSLLAIDEGTILFKFPSYARTTGVIPVHGRKWGCNFLVAAQEIKTIWNSCAGNDIFTNLDNIFCGYIQEQAIPEMVEKLQFRLELIKPYSSDAFKPSSELLQSYWYLKRGQQHIELTHPASKLLLALGATDLDEDAARSRVMALYPNDPIKGLKQFAELNAIAKQQGQPMDSICEVIDDEQKAA